MKRSIVDIYPKERPAPQSDAKRPRIGVYDLNG